MAYRFHWQTWFFNKTLTKFGTFYDLFNTYVKFRSFFQILHNEPNSTKAAFRQFKANASVLTCRWTFGHCSRRVDDHYSTCWNWPPADQWKPSTSAMTYTATAQHTIKLYKQLKRNWNETTSSCETLHFRCFICCLWLVEHTADTDCDCLKQLKRFTAEAFCFGWNKTFLKLFQFSFISTYSSRHASVTECMCKVIHTSLKTVKLCY